jgi:hypothetical protein
MTDVAPITLPVALMESSDAVAEQLVRDYLAKMPGAVGGVAYTGSQFDGWDGGGSRPDFRDHFTDSDINAVAMLGVEIHPRAVIELLDRRADDLSRLLAHIPCDVDLHDAPAALIGSGSSAWRLYEQLRDIKHINWVIAHKLCARKRPRLLPVFDNDVRKVVGVRPRDFWESLHRRLASDDAALAGRLARIGAEAGAPDLSVIRVFDVICWMEAQTIKPTGR